MSKRWGQVYCYKNHFCGHCESVANRVAKDLKNVWGSHKDLERAADHINKLEQFIRNGVELGYISVPDKGDSARDIIDSLMDE